ncbi:MAG: BatD family protein [Spirochaetaceae bacterium]|nr:BatD family protein [Spirochaetaceae bacterium]
MALKNSAFLCLMPLFLAARVPAQDEIKILFEFAPDAVIQDEPFTINLLVNHPDPNEIYVRPPDFQDDFRVERMRTEVQVMLDSPRNSEQWTVFEFLLVAGESGAKELGSFEITALGETKITNPVTVNVRPSERRNSNTMLIWDGQNVNTDAVNQGGVYEAVLRVANREKGRRYPALPAWIDAPLNAIVEEVPLSKNDYDSGVVLRLRIVPLDEQPVKINPFSVNYEESLIEVPSLTVNVPPFVKNLPKTKPPETQAPLQTAAPDTPDEPARIKPVSFSVPAGGGTFFDAGVRDCIAEAERLWAGEKYAAALAVLRRGEITLFAAGTVKKVRTACEDALNLPSAPNWAWLPRTPLTAVFIMSAAAFIILLCGGKARCVQLPPLLISLLVSVLAVSVLSFSYFYEKNKAVLKNCAAYPIPEDGVKAAVFFMEGEPVSIHSESDSWIYVESFRPNVLEKYGWVKKENAAMIAR